MFDIAWGEFVVIGVVALIVIGPKELPAVLRAIGQWTTKIRRMATEFQGQFQEALREAEMADLKKEVDSLNDAAKGMASQLTDPLDFKEATKWEPKSEEKTEDTAGATPAATSEAPPSPDPGFVTADGYAPSTAAPEPPAPVATVDLVPDTDAAAPAQPAAPVPERPA
jgi:sec-independent protein translocase protein TatB